MCGFSKGWDMWEVYYDIVGGFICELLYERATDLRFNSPHLIHPLQAAARSICKRVTHQKGWKQKGYIFL